MSLWIKYIIILLLSKYHPCQVKRHNYRAKLSSNRLLLEKKFHAKINSKSYWDNRFKSNDWKDCNGESQTVDFINASLLQIPLHLKEDILNVRNIVDYGCALGDGSNILQTKFPLSKIVGLDISSEGLKIARKKFPSIQFFEAKNLKKLSPFDLFYSSNTFEHIKDPFKELLEISQYIKKYLIIVVPYNELNPYAEHVSLFNEQNIPQIIGDFKLEYFKHYCMVETLGTDATYYIGFDYEQFIFIYKKYE